MQAEDLQTALTNAIGSLPEREAMILQLYFVEEMNLEEIGQTMDIGAARVCQIKKAALAKLKGILAELM
jgi:RNA polymerase sigma factor for flagellar operon FliA